MIPSQSGDRIMPPLSRQPIAPTHSPRRRTRLGVAWLLRLLACTAVAGVISIGPALYEGPLGARPAGATSTVPSAIALVSQTAWVRNTSGMQLRVAVRSTLARSDLALQVTLYSQATERGYFEQSLSGNTDGFFVLSTTSLPLTTKGLMGSDGDASIDLPVAPPSVPGKAVKAPSNGALLDFPCTSQCAGVYPLQVTLEDTATATEADSFMTYLILAPDGAASSLRFSMNIPLGSAPVMTAGGKPDLQVLSADESEISELYSSLMAAPSSAVSLALYPQLSTALASVAGSGTKEAAASRASLATLKKLVALPNVEVTQQTYSAVDVAALARENLPEEAAAQFDAGRAAAAGELGVKTAGRPYVAAAPFGKKALSLVSSGGATQIEVPSDGVGAVPASWDYPVWAPFRVSGTSVEADASDSYLESHLEQSSSDPVLRANQMLADLAILYFVEQPPGNRGVSVLAPLAWHPTASFISTLLEGLSSSPIVAPVTLTQLFNQVPVGSDEIPSGYVKSPLASRQLTGRTPSAGSYLPAGPISTARSNLATLSSLMPKDPGLVHRLELAVLVGETDGLTTATRSTYLDAPAAQLHAVAEAVSLPDRRTITITSLSARIPISISSRANTPLSVDLRLSSCPPARAGLGCRAANLTFGKAVRSFTLAPGNSTTEVEVSARSSGDFPFYLELTTSTGVVLSSSQLTLRSTAISGVAIGLTVAAGAFLLLWWARSALRRRLRGKHMRRATAQAARTPSVAPETP